VNALVKLAEQVQGGAFVVRAHNCTTVALSNRYITQAIAFAREAPPCFCPLNRFGLDLCWFGIAVEARGFRRV